MGQVSVSIRPRWGTQGGRSVYREYWEFAEGELWLWNISLYGSCVRGSWRGFFVRGPEGYERKALGTGTSFYEGSSTRDFEIWSKGALEVECLSLWELCEGNLEGGFSCWGSWRIDRKGAVVMGQRSLKRLTSEGLEGGLLYWRPWVMKGRIRGRASLFMRAQVGKLKWICLPGTFRDGWKGLWSWGVSLYASCVKGTWNKGSLVKDPRG
jgi:hypothetical protein